MALEDSQEVASASCSQGPSLVPHDGEVQEQAFV